jgi:hypothetical protein
MKRRLFNMKWKTRRYKIGDQRTRTAFLFIPKKIETEWRWLERAKWTEEKTQVLSDVGYAAEPSGGLPCPITVWVPIRWEE